MFDVAVSVILNVKLLVPVGTTGLVPKVEVTPTGKLITFNDTGLVDVEIWVPLDVGVWVEGTSLASVSVMLDDEVRSEVGVRVGRGVRVRVGS